MPIRINTAAALPWPSDTFPYAPDGDQDPGSGANLLLGGNPSETAVASTLSARGWPDGSSGAGGQSSDVGYGAPSNDLGPASSSDWTGASRSYAPAFGGSGDWGSGASSTSSVNGTTEPGRSDMLSPNTSDTDTNTFSQYSTTSDDIDHSDPSLFENGSPQFPDDDEATPTLQNVAYKWVGQPTRTDNPNPPNVGRGGLTTGGAAIAQHGSWLDRSPEAKAVVGDVARTAGLAPGAARGAWHSAKDIGHGLDFLSRLFDPNDADDSPRGEAAWDEVIRAGKGAFDYTKNALLNPKVVADDVGAALHGFQVKIDPSASPPASTIEGEAARNFNIGLNRGEALFDAASLLYGGAEAEGLAEFGRASEGATAAKYLARGYPPKVSEYFAKPYEGMGHHFLPRRTELPAWLGGGPVPPAVSNSPLFLLKPRNMSIGDFSELHYGVDPYFHGGRIPAAFDGGGWSGKALGWKKYDRLGRLWYGSPAPLKAAAGAGAVGAGAAVDQVWNGRRRP